MFISLSELSAKLGVNKKIEDQRVRPPWTTSIEEIDGCTVSKALQRATTCDILLEACFSASIRARLFATLRASNIMSSGRSASFASSSPAEVISKQYAIIDLLSIIYRPSSSIRISESFVATPNRKASVRASLVGREGPT